MPVAKFTGVGECASFVLELHENINRPEFVDVILRCCNLTQEPVQILIQTASGLSARIGPPEAGPLGPALAIRLEYPKAR